MRFMMYILLFFVGCIAQPGTVTGQTREFSETLDFEPGGSLRINTQRGAVKLTTWDQSQVEVLARIEAPDGVSRSYAEEAVESAHYRSIWQQQIPDHSFGIRRCALLR